MLKRNGELGSGRGRETATPRVGTPAAPEAIVCVIDDEESVRAGLGSLFRSAGLGVALFETPAEFQAQPLPDRPCCLVLDVRLQGRNGLDFQSELRAAGVPIPVILMTGQGDIPMSVRAMKAGAVDFLPKPFNDEEMLAAVTQAIAADRQRRAAHGDQHRLRSLYETLSPREREIMGLVTAGLMNKQVAARVQLKEITVKIHRGNVMRKMGAQSLADLVRMAELLDARDASAARFGRLQEPLAPAGLSSSSAE